MAGLTAPGVGPIVGHVTHNSARIWTRADQVIDQDVNSQTTRRTLGVLGIFQIGENKVPVGNVPCFYFRMRREFSRTGTITVGHKVNVWKDKPYPLKPDTRYVFRVGILTLDDPSAFYDTFDWEDLITRLPGVANWEQDLRQLPDSECEATFFTFPDPNQAAQRFKFLLGSCRYPGLIWKMRKSDRIFGPMAERSTRRDGARFALMVGDQIYADTLNRFVPIGRADTYTEFQERYVTAYTSPNMRRLMRLTPTYMILDDHEIEDNWDSTRFSKEGGHRLFTLAADAYMSYQWSHGPRSFGKRFYYQFDFGPYPFFALDTRTQRYFSGDPSNIGNRHLLGAPTMPGNPPGQLARLLGWLFEMQDQRGNIPKFVVSPSVLMPSPMNAREANSTPDERVASDSWPGFPNTKRAVLNHIASNQIQNVVFLSGDIHCANVSQIKFSGSEGVEHLKAFAVTSSALYWPFPFADGEPSEYVHDSNSTDQKDTFILDDAQGIEVNYKTDTFTQDDNFCQITIDPKDHSMRIEIFNKYGEIIEEEKWTGLFSKTQKKRLVKKLKFQAW